MEILIVEVGEDTFFAPKEQRLAKGRTNAGRGAGHDNDFLLIVFACVVHEWQPSLNPLWTLGLPAVLRDSRPTISPMGLVQSVFTVGLWDYQPIWRMRSWIVSL